MTALLPCTPQECLIPGAVGQLEIQMSCPKKSCKLPMTYAVICHPHPLYGGTMLNKVVYMIASTFNQLGVGTVRFNFRGVGKSEGEYDQGLGETEDLCAVVQWLEQEYMPDELWLAGFSFGSYVALRAYQRLPANRLLLVAPPVERFDFSQLKITDSPILVIQGRQDEIVSPTAVSQWVTTQMPTAQFQWLEQADHFFHGQLNELREVIITTWGDKNNDEGI
jgi:alpha/beta superfamily hydrolase